MTNTERFINNETYYDERFYGEDELILSLKNLPQYNIHIWDGYIRDIHIPSQVSGETWRGLTRDYHEEVRTWNWEPTEIEDLDEYINDLLLYKGKEFRFEETGEVHELIFDFLVFAKENGLTVMAEVS